MVELQISPKLESLYGLGRQATKLEFCKLCEAPIWTISCGKLLNLAG